MLKRPRKRNGKGSSCSYLRMANECELGDQRELTASTSMNSSDEMQIQSGCIRTECMSSWKLRLDPMLRFKDFDQVSSIEAVRRLRARSPARSQAFGFGQASHNLYQQQPQVLNDI